jgi:hypothetical protein
VDFALALRQRLLAEINRLVSRSRDRLLLRFLPRRAQFNLTSIDVGTQEVPVSWVVPITSDYAVVVTCTSAAQFVGLLSGSVKAGTKTATGCTIIVANTALLPIGVAAFDVLAFPL